jgi:hypothetical protein
MLVLMLTYTLIEEEEEEERGVGGAGGEEGEEVYVEGCSCSGCDGGSVFVGG